MKKHYLFILGIFASCEYTPIIAPAGKTGDISFSTDIQPIFTAKCTGCHAGASAPKGLDLTAGKAYNDIVPGFVNLNSPEESVIYTHPSPDGSHYAKYSSSEAENILNWIKQGALDN